MTQKQWRSNRVENGLCAKCGNKRDRNGWYCTTCLKQERERGEKNREFYKSIGICPYCGKNKLWGDEKRCIECHSKIKSNWRNLPVETKKKVRRNKFKKQEDKI